MAEEADSLFAGPSVVMPGTHAEGAWTATAIFAVVGAALGLIGGLVWAFAVSSPFSVVARLAIPAIA
ncbi:MAG: hypothetical protein KY393_05775, partial [Actinobacteria bacterium]|nr:hypothetical protein [Actinomycetota bacterium]